MELIRYINYHSVCLIPNSLLIRVTTQYNDLETDEINILTGALRLKQKCVKVKIFQRDTTILILTKTFITGGDDLFRRLLHASH